MTDHRIFSPGKIQPFSFPRSLQEVTDQLADPSQSIPKVPEQVYDGIHASAIAVITSDDDLP